jgi:hypothetical protein
VDPPVAFFPFHTLIPFSMSFTVHQEKSTRPLLLLPPPFCTSSLLKLSLSRSFRYQSTQVKIRSFSTGPLRSWIWRSIGLMFAKLVERALRLVLLAKRQNITSRVDAIPRPLMLTIELETK